MSLQCNTKSIANTFYLTGSLCKKYGILYMFHLVILQVLLYQITVFQPLLFNNNNRASKRILSVQIETTCWCTFSCLYACIFYAHGLCFGPLTWRHCAIPQHKCNAWSLWFSTFTKYVSLTFHRPQTLHHHTFHECNAVGKVQQFKQSGGVVWFLQR